MSTRLELRNNVRTNLADAGITYYSEAEINTSLQDAYDQVAVDCLCIVKDTTLSWLNNLVYYDFQALGVSDYLGCIAIFNNATNQWLRDDLSLRDFDRLRRDWECWNGQVQFWAPHSIKRIAVAPHHLTASGTFKLVYWALAPTLQFDLDVPIIAADMHDILEWYSTADLLETAQEVTKAQPFWTKYKDHAAEYKTRCAKLAAADLLLRV